jgi:DNA-binding LacI/PurR family transcriptional regulator
MLNVTDYVKIDYMPESIIKIIARELSTSTATVSRALNDKPGVGEELRVRILEKARALNYAPSAMARGLATAQTLAVGFFFREKPGLSAYTDPFYGEILHGVEQALARSPYHVTIATLTDDILAVPAQFRFTQEKRIDGMILAGPDIPADFILAMTQTGLPTVLVDNCLEFSKTHSVTSDDEGGAYLAARYLLEQGHRRIGVLSGPTRWPSNRRRVEGYRRALSEAGLPMPTAYADKTTIESGQTALRALLKENPDITALCAVNDSMALGAIRAASAAGRKVPDDLSVIGFDNIAWGEMSEPPLTTIHIPKQQLGTEAANRLILLLTDPDTEPTNLTISVRLIERASSGRPPE